jgi:hypothetical protein
MIIDGDTHIAPNDQDFVLEKHLKNMERAGVDKTLVWLSPHHYVGKEIIAHNRYVYEAAKTSPDRILPFGWTDPTIGVHLAKDMVKMCVEEFGFHGVKMNGAQNNYFIDDDRIALPVVEEIAKTGKLLAFHVGPDAYERTHPWRAMRIARMFPEMTILMVHMGMTSSDMNRAVVEVAKVCLRMVLIASATSDKAALKAIQELGVNRVCFGSDSPFKKMNVVKTMFETSFSEELSAEQMESFMGKNLASLLQID